MSIDPLDPNLLEILASRRRNKKKKTKMIGDPHAGRRTEKTPEQLRIIKQQKDADDRRRLEREAEIRKRRKAIAAQKRADIKREKEIEEERQAHRKAQQEERERLAMRDSFGDPEAEEEYDPYAFGFGDEDSVKLRF